MRHKLCLIMARNYKKKYTGGHYKVGQSGAYKAICVKKISFEKSEIPETLNPFRADFV